MQKPEFKIDIDVEYTLHEEILVRQMQRSDLHYFEAGILTTMPAGYDVDKSFPGWTRIVGPYNPEGQGLDWALSLITNDQSGWLIIANAWPEQPDVDVVKELTEAFDLMLEEEGLTVDFHIKLADWRNDRAPNSDVTFDWDGDNATKIEQLFDECFPPRTIGNVHSQTFLAAIEQRGHVRDEQDLRESWAELDRMSA